jgi:hypothetical protein
MERAGYHRRRVEPGFYWEGHGRVDESRHNKQVIKGTLKKVGRILPNEIMEKEKTPRWKRTNIKHRT